MTAYYVVDTENEFTVNSPYSNKEEADLEAADICGTVEEYNPRFIALSCRWNNTNIIVEGTTDSLTVLQIAKAFFNETITKFNGCIAHRYGVYFDTDDPLIAYVSVGDVG